MYDWTGLFSHSSNHSTDRTEIWHTDSYYDVSVGHMKEKSFLKILLLKGLNRRLKSVRNTRLNRDLKYNK